MRKIADIIECVHRYEAALLKGLQH